MSDKILYAKQVDEEPIQTIPVANEPRVIIGEYIENKAVLSWNPSDANDLSHYNITGMIH